MVRSGSRVASGLKAMGVMGLACAMGEAGTFDRQGPKDGAKDRVMAPLLWRSCHSADSGVAAEVRLHLPLHHDFLQGLEHGLAFRQREAQSFRGQIMALHTGHFA